MAGRGRNLVANETGFACEDLEAWLLATGALLRNPARRWRVGQAARTYALGRRWDVALRPLFATYRQAVAL